MLLLLDNYDSFTYNLAQYLSELGATVEVCRNDEVTCADVEAMQPSQIVISPGPRTPTQAGRSVEIIERFVGKVPILGVCLGHQAIAVAMGGTIRRAKRLMHGKTSRVLHDGRTLYERLAQPFVAMRYHSLAVDAGDLPTCLEVSAWTEDGEIMGLRHRELPLEGVQFHPESILTSEGKSLLRNFLRLQVGERRQAEQEQVRI